MKGDWYRFILSRIPLPEGYQGDPARSRTLLELLLEGGGVGPEGPEGPAGPEGPTGDAEYVRVADVKAAGTAGGTFTSGAWRARGFNTIVADPAGLASIDSITVTLQPGTWLIVASAPAAGVGRHQIRVRSIFGTAALGTSEACAGTAPVRQTRSFAVGVASFASERAFTLEHRCTTTVADTGFGVAGNFGEPEVYATLEAWRIVPP